MGKRLYIVQYEANIDFEGGIQYLIKEHDCLP